MNSIVGGYLAGSFFPEYQALRDQLMEILSDEDLGLRLGGETMSLGELCREIGEIEHTYVESFRTFRQDFSYRNPDLALEGAWTRSRPGTRSSIATSWRPLRRCPRRTSRPVGSSAAT